MKSFCESLENDPIIARLLLDESDWRSVYEIQSTLQPFTIATKKLQSPNVTLSDFYGMWFNLKLKIQRQNDAFGKNLLAHMEKRHNNLIEIPVMLSAVYLDPRYNILLSSQQRNEAEIFLESLHQRIKANDAEQFHQLQNSNMTDDLLLDEVTNYIHQIRNLNVQNDQQIPNANTVNIKQLLRSLNDKEQVTKPILEYWEENKSYKPELYELAKILYAIPPTQCSVERAFSALALVLTPLRTKLSDQLLENILIVRLNKTIFFSDFKS